MSKFSPPGYEPVLVRDGVTAARIGLVTNPGNA